VTEQAVVLLAGFSRDQPERLGGNKVTGKIVTKIKSQNNYSNTVWLIQMFGFTYFNMFESTVLTIQRRSLTQHMSYIKRKSCLPVFHRNRRNYLQNNYIYYATYINLVSWEARNIVICLVTSDTCRYQN